MYRHIINKKNNEPLPHFHTSKGESLKIAGKVAPRGVTAAVNEVKKFKPTKTNIKMLTVQTVSNKKTKLAIRPFLPDQAPIEDIGLWEAGEVLMPGAKQVDQIACLEGAAGVRRYVTGLNELAPEVLRLAEKERKAKVRQIRTDIIYLEKILAANAISEDEKTMNLPTTEFMDKVMIVKPNNFDFWESRDLFLSLDNGAIFLDTVENAYHFIKLRAIEAGGYDLVAPSYSEAKKKGKYKWYLDRFEQTVADKTVLAKVKNKAIAELQKLSDNDNEKLRYVLKALLIDCSGYKPSTPNDSLYEDADAYINGRGEERAIKKAAQSFLDMTDKKIEDLKLLAIVKDANIYNFLITKGDGKIYHAKSSSMVGANVQEVVEYLKNPLNEKILLDLQTAVEAEWIK